MLERAQEEEGVHREIGFPVGLVGSWVGGEVQRRIRFTSFGGSVEE